MCCEKQARPSSPVAAGNLAFARGFWGFLNTSPTEQTNLSVAATENTEDDTKKCKHIQRQSHPKQFLIIPRSSATLLTLGLSIYRLIFYNEDPSTEFPSEQEGRLQERSAHQEVSTIATAQGSSTCLSTGTKACLVWLL